MEIFRRDKAIERLMHLLDIPRLKFIFSHKQGIGPYDPEFFEKNHAHRRECEQKAEIALHGMTNEDLYELSETPGRLDIFALENSLFDDLPRDFSSSYD